MSVVDDIMAIRTPKPKFPVIHAMTRRFSPRVFSDEPVLQEAINSIFEAARLTPSASNREPWFFYYAHKGTPAYNKLASFLPDTNAWAKGAPVLIVACYDPTHPTRGSNPWTLYDLGQSVVSLVLQAQEKGYYCRQIGTFDIERAKQEIPVQDAYLPFTMIAMGKMGTEEDYQKANQEVVKKDLIPAERKETISKELK